MIYLVFGIVVIYLFLIAPRPGEHHPELFGRHYAHRGLHSKDHRTPENSLAAFCAARDAGYGMELDINLTRDGRVVVFHDNDLERMCGVPGAIADWSWEKLAKLRLFDTEQGIPLFSDVLAAVDGRVPLVVEIKDCPRRYELCGAAASLLDNYQGTFCIESFHPGIVRWFRRHRPGVVRGQLSAGPENFEDQSAPVRLLLSSLLTNVATRPDFVAYRHQDSAGKLRWRGSGFLRLRLLLFRLLGGALLTWTVTDDDDHLWCLRKFDSIIFEFIAP